MDGFYLLSFAQRIKDVDQQEAVNNVRKQIYKAWYQVNLGNGNIGEEQEDYISVKTKDAEALIDIIHFQSELLALVLMEKYQDDIIGADRCS